jgi:hypothetical protein
MRIAEWHKTYPEAKCIGVEGVAEKKPEIKWEGVMGQGGETKTYGFEDEVRTNSMVGDNGLTSYENLDQAPVLSRTHKQGNRGSPRPNPNARPSRPDLQSSLHGAIRKSIDERQGVLAVEHLSE